jgi:protein-S-isoprenylcysteine O-methyltransferase Ste14
VSDLHYLIDVPWIVFAAYWLISALKTRRTVHREPFVARYGVMLIEVFGFTLLWSRDADIGVLGQHFLPRSLAQTAVAIVLAWTGIAIALWARYNLGQFWSGRITLKEDHHLIRSGPYVYVRHPIYTGLDLAAIGSALSIDRWRCVLGGFIIIVGFVIKAKREEALLLQQFGASFEEHRKRTGFLIPQIWKELHLNK